MPDRGRRLLAIAGLRSCLEVHWIQLLQWFFLVIPAKAGIYGESGSHLRRDDQTRDIANV
jgi:hypothetical protein